MYFAFTDEQKLLAETLKNFLSKECDAGKIRRVWDLNEPILELWEGLAELGVHGVQAPESLGGFGFSEIEQILLMEEVGYHALPAPLLQHSAIAVPTLAEAQDSPLAREWLSGALTGEVIICVGSLNSSYVAYGEMADAFLLPESGNLYLLTKDQVKLDPQKSLDAPKNPTRLEWEPAKSALLEGADVELCFDRGILAVAGECLGIAQKLLDFSVEYVKEREQFGKPIGSQQAIKHHLADVAIALEHARPSVYAAAWDLASGESDISKRQRNISAGKAMASETASLAARKALQCFGAIGYTVENDLNFWLKKAWVTANEWGSENYHLDRVASLL